jgi:hypothetical protein
MLMASLVRMVQTDLTIDVAMAYAARCLIRLANLLPHAVNMRQIGKEVEGLATVIAQSAYLPFKLIQVAGCRYRSTYKTTCCEPVSTTSCRLRVVYPHQSPQQTTGCLNSHRAFGRWVLSKTLISHGQRDGTLAWRTSYFPPSRIQ